MMRPKDNGGRWIVHGVRSIYQSEWVSVGLADVSVPSGDRFEHHTVALPAAAMTVVLDDTGDRVLMTWRHRFVPDVWNWELPGGLLDGGEAPGETAVREVEEETGYRPRSIEHLLTYEPMIGSVRSPHHVFLARGAERISTPSEANEGSFEWIRTVELPELIAAGRIGNSGSLIGLLYVLAMPGREDVEGIPSPGD